MIAAAHADGTLDDDERTRIFKQLENLGLSQEEHDFMERELHAPWNAAALAASASSPDVARQVYADSLLAIEVDTPEERAAIACERLRKAFENHWVRVDGGPVRVTVSIGVAGCESRAETALDLLKRADVACYRAKAEGRNRVCCAGTSLGE